jgi:cell shape-determining protein MreC
MGELRTIVIVAGIMIPFYLVFRNPKEYFEGLLKSIYDKSKSQLFHLLVVIFAVIAIPLVYLANFSWESMDIIAVLLLGIAFIWKAYEIFKNPKAYFKGLFKKHNDTKRTSQEPIGLLLMSGVVLVAYFFEFFKY